jgi:hypothetical protein
MDGLLLIAIAAATLLAALLASGASTAVPARGR